MSAIDYSLSRKGKLRKKMQKLVVGLTLSGLVLSGASASLFLNTVPAYAAPLAYGYGFNNPGYDYILGSWRTVDGNIAYCIQLQVPSPTDNQTFAGQTNVVTVGDGTTVSGDQVAQINYVLNKWGETDNDLQAAAVAWAIWYLTGQVNDQGIYTSFDTGFDESIFTFAGNQAQANLEWDDVTGLLDGGALYDMFVMMTDEALNNYDDPAPATPADITISGSVVNGEFVGTANVPAGYNTVTLSNATFDSNSSATISPNRQAGSFDWTAVTIPDSATSNFSVSVSGEYSTPTTGDTVNYWSSPDSQDLVGPPPLSLGSSADSISLDIGFSPELETLVPVKRLTGDGSGNVTVSDTVTFSVNSSAAAPYNSDLRQFENGEYAQIVAEGTLYGPLATEPVQGSTVPSDAPVAATTSITTSATSGFNETYSASVSVPDIAGFYTWVWEINSDAQPAETQPLIPADYSFQDDFGIPDETAFAPTKLSFSTELTSNRGEAGTVVQDDLTTSVDGFWLANADGNIPANLTGTVYYHGTSQPVQQSTVPSSAEAVQTLTLEVSEADTTYSSEDIVFPERVGFYTVQWCIDTNEFFVAFCDDYGVPAETFEVFSNTPPAVTTQAQLTARFGEQVTDTATVTGNIPGNSFLRFTAYREAVAGDPKFSTDGSVIADQVWTAEELDALTEAELCDIQPVGTTGLTPVPNAGVYVSEPIQTTPAGSNHRLFWVEELITVDPDTGDEVLLDRGECGEPTEITYVSWPTITTNAGGAITVGESRGDRTTVSYANADLNYEVTHELYYAGVNADAAAPVCDADNLVFSTSDEPVALTGSEEYEFVSAAYTYERAGTYYWVERLFYEGQEVAAGYCGNPDETVTASIEPIDPEPNSNTNPPPAANINGTASPLSIGFLTVGALLVLAGAATAVGARRIV